MLDILYFILIYPLEQSLDFILGFLIKCLHSPALSIIAISILINLFLFKLFVYTDRLAESDKAIKQKLDSRIKGWKSVYKGAKLHAFTKTLYRQNHYHPIFALRGLGGLALQIPFFIAIAAVISKSSVFEGISFLWINDLSKPDSVLFANLHILPLLMTIFTLLNVFISSKERAARIQGTLIALIFLVLLYNMPSALVLYWTINTLFYLLKSVINNYKLSLRRNKSQETSKIFSVIHHHCDSSKESSSCHKPTTCHSEGVQSMTEESANTRFFAHTRNDKVDSIDCHASQVKLAMTKGVCCHKSINVDSSNDNTNKSLYINISIFAILNISFLICVFSPFAVYSSDVSQFDPTQTSATLSALFGIFLLSSFVCIYLTSFFYNTRLLKLGTFAASVILLIGLVYTFILDYNVVTAQSYGAMEAMMFLDISGIMIERIHKYIDLAIGVLSCCMIFVILRFSLHFLLKCMQILLLVLVIVACIDVCKIYNITSTFKAQQNHSAQQTKQATSINPNPYLSKFSKNNLNIIVLMFDAFTGSHLKILLEQNPNLYHQLDGFVYFDNTTTASSFTHTSLPSVFGGEYYSAYEINKRMPKNLDDERMRAFPNIINSFLAHNYQVGMDIYGIDPADKITHNKNHFIATKSQDGAYYLNLYEKNYNFSLEQAIAEVSDDISLLDFISFGLFKFSPYVFRVRVLNVEDTSWRLHTGEKKSSTTVIKAATFHIAQLTSIVDNSTLGATTPTLKLIASGISHDSFAFNELCKPSIRPTPNLPQQYRDLIPKLFWGKYNSEVCALKEVDKWILWLKNKNIYDNTLFIIVSDHGRADSYPQLKIAGNKFPGYYTDTLLLVKEPKSRGNLRTDSRLMSNTDTASIICSFIGGCPNVPDNILTHYPQNREVVHFYPKYFQHDRHAPTHYILESLWKVKGNIFDPANWTNISYEFLDTPHTK